MEDAEIHRRRVEQTIAARQLLGVAFAKFHAGVTAPGVSDHGRREIDAKHRRAALGSRRGNVAWPTGDIEKAHAFLQAHRLEQRRNRLPGQWAEGIMVTRGYFLPAGQFEIAEFFRVRDHLQFTVRGISLLL